MLHCSDANRTIAKTGRRRHLAAAPGGVVNPGDEWGPMRAKFFRGNVFVANVPPEFSDEQLAEAFDPFGIVLSAHVARDPATGERLRYGFVDIATERAAARAVAVMNGATLGGHSLDVRLSERPAKSPAAPGELPRRAPLRLGGQRGAAAGAGDRFVAVPVVRRQPTFQVERRSLPRRPLPPR
jgi:RNA recognition motif-containing protein